MFAINYSTHIFTAKNAIRLQTKPCLQSEMLQNLEQLLNGPKSDLSLRLRTIHLFLQTITLPQSGWNSLASLKRRMSGVYRCLVAK